MNRSPSERGGEDKYLGTLPGLELGRPARSIVTTQPTPRSRVLHEKLTVPQLVKKFLVFYGTACFINVFTRARHLFLS